MRIALAGFVQESNSFSPVQGSWLHFGPGQVMHGKEVVDQLGGTRSEVGGVLDMARSLGLDVVPLLLASASASAGPLRSDVFAKLLGDLRAGLRLLTRSTRCCSCSTAQWSPRVMTTRPARSCPLCVPM